MKYQINNKLTNISELNKISVIFEVKAVDQLPYQSAYDNFILYFKDKDKINEHDFYIATNFVYGWMPTILKYKDNELKECVELVNLVKNGTRLNVEQLKVLKKTINNSIVGTSKLLHFVNPELYAIWDSRVCKYLYGSTNITNTISRFLEYITLCDKIKNLEQYDEIHKKYERKFNCKVSHYRSIEQLFYLNDIKE